LSNASRLTVWTGVRKKLVVPSPFTRLYEYWNRTVTGVALVLFEMSIAVRKSAVPTTRVTTGTSTEYETAEVDADAVRTDEPLWSTRVGAAESTGAERVVAAATRATAQARRKRAFIWLSPVIERIPHGNTQPPDTCQQFPVQVETLHSFE